MPSCSGGFRREQSVKGYTINRIAIHIFNVPFVFVSVYFVSDQLCSEDPDPQRG